MTGTDRRATHVGVAPDTPRDEGGWRDSHGWFAVALLAGVVVSVTYLRTHAYPAYGAGLYLEAATQIRLQGYSLPTAIPYYTGGIPFAYPPLGFYLTAVLLDVGLSGLTVSRVLPAALTVCYLVPYYGIALELLPTRRQAGVATTLLAFAPPTLQWHLSAGGIVRATAFLLALCGVYAGCRVFHSSDRRWVVPGAVLFGLTALTHPVYTVFFGLSWLVLYVARDRSVHGLLAGAFVAAGGLALAGPWWATVLDRHGVGVFTAAAGSHSGLAGGAERLLDQFVYPLDPTVVTAFFVAVFVASALLVARGSYVLPSWLVVGAYVVGKERFQFVAGSMIVATVALGVVAPALSRWRPELDHGRAPLVVVCVLLVVGGSIGTLYAASELDSAHHGSPSLPPFVDDDDVSAMTWAATETAPGDSFVVVGDAAEWFPYYTDRSILVGPWGIEWVSSARYYEQLDHVRRLGACTDADCLSDALAAADVSPTYVYVPTGPYTVRGLEREGASALAASLVDSDRFRRVYANDGVSVFRVDPAPTSPGDRRVNGSGDTARATGRVA